MLRHVVKAMCSLALVLTASCARHEEEDAKGPLVLAAASLQDALSAAAQEWQQQGHAAPVLSFAATSALARQIEAGAPADLFISADEKWMDEIAAKDALQPGTRGDLLANSLVLIAPADSTARLPTVPGADLATALDGGRLAMADPEAVPAGRYARQALVTLGAWEGVAGHAVMTDNVRVALSLVARGEAALGIVYATDAQAEPGVRVVATFPPASHTPITYPMAILSTSRHADTAGFAQFLRSGAGQAIFARYGFTAPGAGSAP